MKQKTVSGTGISWAIRKSAPRSRQIKTPAPHQSVFYRPDALPAAQPTASKLWRQKHWSPWTGIQFRSLLWTDFERNSAWTLYRVTSCSRFDDHVVTPPPTGERSIVLSVSVCLYVCVCLSAVISSELHVRSSPSYLCMLPTAVAQSSSGGVVICYVLPFYGWRRIWS